MGPFPHDAPAAIISADNPMGTDGFEFVERLRANEAWREIPVIVVTAKDFTPTDRLRLNGYVEKILQKGEHGRDHLLAEVRELVQSSVARRRPIA